MTARRFARSLVGVAIAITSATACAPPGSSAVVLRIGTTGTVESLNPFVSDDTLSFDFFQAMYPHLVEYDLKTTRLVRSFAQSWTSSGHDRVRTFRLVRGATWSDGAPLDATDVAWTVNLMIRFRHGPTAAWAGATDGMIGASAPDAGTLRIRYRRRVANALALIARIPVLPRQYWARYARGAGKALTRATNTPPSATGLVSGGPYVFVRYLKGQAALFRTNARYWGDAPHVDGFGVQFFGNDDAEVSALKAGEIDLAMGNPSLPATDVAPLRRSGLRIHRQPSVSYDDLIINTNPKKKVNRELLDPLVRRALEYATDRDAIDTKVLLGYARSGASIIPPATGAWHDNTVRPLPHDAAAANRLLDAAGYRRGGNGVRIADGHEMSYRVLVSPDVVGGLRMGQLLTQSFAAVGVRLAVRQIDDDALEDAISEDDYRRFDLALWGWDTEYDPSYMLEGMTCAQYDNDNDSGYCNRDYDRMFAAQSTATTAAARLAIVHRMQTKIFDDRPYIVLHYLDVIEGWSREWTPVTEGPTGFLSQFSVKPLIDVARTG